MGSITKYAKHLKGNLYEKSYQYLIDNFHKFTEDNKIKVAVDMLKIYNKDGEKENLQSNHLTMVIANSKELPIEIQKRLDEFSGIISTNDSPA